MPKTFDKANQENEILNEWYDMLQIQYEVIKSFEIPVINKILKKYEVKTLSDIGCGTGHITRDLEKSVNNRIIAIEPNEYFLNKTKKLLEKTKIKLNKTKFEDFSTNADCFLFRYLFQHYEDKDKLSQRVARLIKPKGIAIVIEPLPLISDPDIKLYHEISKKFRSSYKRGLSKKVSDEIINSFEKFNARLVEDIVIDMPLLTTEMKKLLSDMMYKAGKIKVLLSDQDRAILF